MVQKNSKWNLTKERGEEIAHRYILEILHDSKGNKILLSDLIILLNQRTKHITIKHHSKKKNMSIYIKSIYGSFINFLDSFSMYGVLYLENDIYALLNDKELSFNNLTKDIISENKEWVLVDEEEFFLV
mgnify:CR=1 FL=1|tara:strand:+ start:413 stop:799 length:387 start_codon:yes stop_codon:yes gene_type:complete